jgi:hypothetical protein
MQSGFEPLPLGHRDAKLPLLLDEAVEALMHSGGRKLGNWERKLWLKIAKPIGSMVLVYMLT